MRKQSTFQELIKQLWFALRVLGLPLLLRAARYSLEKRYAELKYAEPLSPRGGLPLLWQALRTLGQTRPHPPPFDAYRRPGPVHSWRQDGATLLLTCEQTVLQLTALEPSLIRVRMNQHGIFNAPFSYAVLQPKNERPKPPVELVAAEATLLFKTSELTVRINRADSAIDFLDAAGRPVNLDGGGVAWQGDWVALRRNLPPDAPVFGLGERPFPFDLRGRRYTTWNRDPGGFYRPAEDPIHQAHPWFISQHDDRAFGILLDNTFRSIFDIAADHPERATVTAAGGELRYYFIHGPTIAAVLERLTALTGRMPLPPLWSLGLHQSRWGYKSQKMVMSIARQFRERQIPCDAIHLDIDYMKQYSCFTWNRRRFPEPGELSGDLRHDGFRLVGIIDPGIKADRLNDLAEQGLKADVFLKYPDGKPFRGPVWPGDCYFPDFTDPAVRIWWGERFRPLLDDGLAGFWNDMNEPSVFSATENTIPDPVQHCFEGRQADHGQMHNVYGMQMARATREGLRALRPQRRPFVLSRAGFSGIQRYAAVWTGDNESSWEHLRLSISMAFNLGLSGVPFVGPDIGGFFGPCEPELFIRWLQTAALFPLCRIHSARLTPDQEPWSFGAEIEAAAKRMIELRYRLLPYIYTAFWQASQTGLPIVRPLILAFPTDRQAHPCEDQFMIGDSLLAAPVVTPQTTQRKVYLPAGRTWVDYWRGTFHEGGTTLAVDAPLNHLPLFVKAGAVIPHWPLIQHTDQAKTLTRMDLHLYVADGQSVLYEDLGEGFTYRQGHFRQTRFNCRPGPNRIIVTIRAEGEYRAPYERYNWLVYTPETFKPGTIMGDGLPISDWFSGRSPDPIVCQTPIIQRLEIWAER